MPWMLINLLIVQISCVYAFAYGGAYEKSGTGLYALGWLAAIILQRLLHVSAQYCIYDYCLRGLGYVAIGLASKKIWPCIVLIGLGIQCALMCTLVDDAAYGWSSVAWFENVVADVNAAVIACAAWLSRNPQGGFAKGIAAPWARGRTARAATS